jgi:agmatinase
VDQSPVGPVDATQVPRNAGPATTLHVGIRGPLYAAGDLADTEALGYRVIACTDYDRLGLDEVITAMRERLDVGPVYVSVDIDVVDPGMAPGTGTPEADGPTSRGLLATLRGLAGADVVEVAPAYDYAEVTGIAASHVAYDLLSVMARRPCAASDSGSAPAGAQAKEDSDGDDQ